MAEIKEIRFERMRPGELEETAREQPVAWMPLGTLEWHGRHLPVGLDALKAHALCSRIAERAGGVVLPANYFSTGGMPFPWTFKYNPSLTARAVFDTLRRLSAYGFKVIFIITGHYPPHQVLLLMAVAEAFMASSDAVVVALPEFSMAAESGYNGDHAAKWETSLMMELCPDLVDENEMSKLSGKSWLALFQRGIQGENPADAASREAGAEAVAEIIEKYSELADSLLASRDKSAARKVHRKAIADFIEYQTGNIKEQIDKYLVHP
ncbi:MAG: creatininase family protein [bacterium]